ncbi:putative lipoyl transferase protein [Botrytis fragariae]|uniref:lipoyl(octanoyl) transferase n=1 Tax=Botrytis fragariae TaxID=1964551 RepID=A0A8H6AI37_9HELO|nr:putative lipoyl transferase protein [Botrytis fragariae]KAF5867894.1 putative lipoyl transferase protein [Botrytis fragariae]
MIPLPPPSVRSNFIRHIHLSGVTPFHIAQTIQSTLVSRLLEYKKETSAQQDPDLKPPAPIPTVLTFQPTPVYTTGRRELQTPLSEPLLKSLREPLIPLSTTHLLIIRKPFSSSSKKEQIADVVQTPRGGLITFHGPGQLVIYPIIDLLAFRNLGAKCYVNLLEESTIRLLHTMGLNILGRTENPGVWLNEGEKIASLGVHLRRNVSSYGVGLNMIMERGWWDRITACGLNGKKIVGIDEQLSDIETRDFANQENWRSSYKAMLENGAAVAQTWVDEFAAGLGRLDRGEKCEESKTTSEKDILSTSEETTKLGNVNGTHWTGWEDMPESVKNLIPLDIRGGNELNISTGGGYVEYRRWKGE